MTLSTFLHSDGLISVDGRREQSAACRPAPPPSNGENSARTGNRALSHKLARYRPEATRGGPAAGNEFRLWLSRSRGLQNKISADHRVRSWAPRKTSGVPSPGSWLTASKMQARNRITYCLLNPICWQSFEMSAKNPAAFPLEQRKTLPKSAVAGRRSRDPAAIVSHVAQRRTWQ